MEQAPYSQMRFDRRMSQPVNLRSPSVQLVARLVAVGVGIAAVHTLWQHVSPDIVYWVLLLLVGGLVWVASYGWRRALQSIRALVDWLERLGA